MGSVQVFVFADRKIEINAACDPRQQPLAANAGRIQGGHSLRHPLPFSRPIREPQRQREKRTQRTPGATAPPQGIQGGGSGLPYTRTETRQTSYRGSAVG